MTTLGLWKLKKELKQKPRVRQKVVTQSALPQKSIIVKSDSEKISDKPIIMTLVFDMDGTLTEPWYGEKSPLFYVNETDAVLRARTESAYKYVKPLPYVKDFLDSCIEFYGEGYVAFKSLTRIVNGKEYQDKVEYFKDYFDKYNFEILGAISEEDKLIYLKDIADKSRVIYFDDTIGTLNKVNDLDTKHFILSCHSTAMLMHDIKQIDKAWYLEQLEREGLEYYGR